MSYSEGMLYYDPMSRREAQSFCEGLKQNTVKDDMLAETLRIAEEFARGRLLQDHIPYTGKKEE